MRVQRVGRRSDVFGAAPSDGMISVLPMLLAFLVMAFQTVAAQPSIAPAERTVTAALFSDPHLDPFQDPSKAKRLAAAPVAQWASIFAEPSAADADVQFATLQKACNERLPDASASLELSAMDDARTARPAVVLVAGDMLAHAFGCRYRTLLDPSGSDAAGLADFAAKTVEFQLIQLQQHFPGVPIHFALGNNDSDCEDYAIDEDSRFLRRLAETVAAGWGGDASHERTAAKQDFIRFGSYALPLAPSLPNTRVIVLDDLYLSADYKGTCGKQTNHSSAAALLKWLGAQLADARRTHQSVWVLAHIPPEVNVYRTYLHPHDICHGQPPDMFFPDEALAKLLVQYSDSVRVFISGHTHVDEIHLIEGGPAQPASIPLKTIPSISPISTNAPAYLLAQIDLGTGTLLDYRKRIASFGGGAVQWSTAYDFRQTDAEPAFTAASITDLLHRWQSEPERSATQIENYQSSLASGLRLFALRASWPQQLCAMQHSSAAGFASCACSAPGGLLPPTQNAK